LGAIILPKKNSRHNPWGNYSYSDIIVQVGVQCISLFYKLFNTNLQAIATSPEQRLTLNQVYDWMISAIPYFSDRQDNASSAGWKVDQDKTTRIMNQFFRIRFGTTFHSIKSFSRFRTRTQENLLGGQSTLKQNRQTSQEEEQLMVTQNRSRIKEKR
jgi:hypothetical protein